uniref:Reverse transcriptase domain-containing protein n=1 Tax=Tanacetum cinerariifolium TaxID=118510 RepID=A0A6L2P2X5_TANCI|nr:reverse transcriptase domain-containing protein [Tanacetum cinerariifolium]
MVRIGGSSWFKSKGEIVKLKCLICHLDGHLKSDHPMKNSSGSARKGKHGNSPDDEGGSYHMTPRRDFLYDLKGFDSGLVQLGENRASWSDKLDDALWAFRTAYKTPIGCTPYKMIYRKACHLPIELEHKAY